MAASPGNFRRIALLLAACLLLGGCVYLRLLELKRQLSDFDRYFAVNQTDGLALTFEKPVLQLGDMAFFNLAPETLTRIGAATRWHLRWIKGYAVPGERPADYAVTADFIFVDGELKHVRLPEQFFAFVPKKLVLQSLRSFGRAEINRTKRSVQTAIAASPDLPPFTVAGLLRFLGAPLEIHRKDGFRLLHYRYVGVDPEHVSGNIDLTFTLDDATQTVVRLEGSLFHATFRLDWPNPGGQLGNSPKS